MKILLACILIFLPAGLAAPPATAGAAHKFYASLAQIEYNDETKTVEVAMRVFADDLEAALARRHGRVVHLDQSERAGELVCAYLSDHFRIRARNGEMKRLRWVGMQVQADVAWLYFEAEMPEGLSGAAITNRVLFDHSAQQVNVVHVKRGENRVDLVFRAGDAGFKSLS